VKSLPVRGIELFFADVGNGIPLVLAHGFPLDHAMWAGQLEGLGVANRCRVIAPDLRGFGRSQASDDVVPMSQFADDIAALLDELHIAEPIVFCGLSMGGYIAFEFWRRHRSRLRGLILCDTRAAADSPGVAEGRRQTADRVVREGLGFLADAMLPRLFSETTRQRRPDLIESVRKSLIGNNVQGVAAASRGMAQRADMTGVLSQMDCPALVVVGEDDLFSMPDEMQGMARAIPNASFVKIAAAGHMAPLENAAEVNAAIRAFLADLCER
jgi:pimeloyl-ACP methyl ester carboxylesterase